MLTIMQYLLHNCNTITLIEMEMPENDAFENLLIVFRRSGTMFELTKCVYFAKLT